MIGAQASEKTTAAIGASRKNESFVDHTDRIVADPSGGMAYEYGSSHMSYDDVKTRKHEDFTAAYLFVWKADRGACKVAAEMAEPENMSQQPAPKN